MPLTLKVKCHQSLFRLEILTRVQYVFCPQQLLAATPCLITTIHPLSIRSRGKQLLSSVCTLKGMQMYMHTPHTPKTHSHTHTHADIQSTGSVSKTVIESVLARLFFPPFRVIFFLYLLFLCLFLDHTASVRLWRGVGVGGGSI